MATRTTLKFDELNVLDSKSISGKSYPKAIPYREYFGAMYITPEKMRSRIELANEIEDVMLYVFAYWIIAAEAEISKDEIKQDAKDKLTSVIAKHTKLDPYLEKHISKVIDEVVDVTEKNAKKKSSPNNDEQAEILREFLEDMPEDEREAIERQIQKMDNQAEDDEDTEQDYWTSKERAMLISENEANAFNDYMDYREAKEKGYTKKTWLTENDEKVRLSHTLEEGKTIGIDDLFLVGTSKMRFPKDDEYDPDPSEVINCRCACKYS